MTVAHERGDRTGFTLVELLIVLAIIATLSALAIPRYRTTMRMAKTSVAINDIRNIQGAIELYELKWKKLHADLSALDLGPLIDPWGEPYYYLDFSTVKGKGKLRKDKFLVPLNSSYDLYSSGPDRSTRSPLTAKQSADDIIRANDGDFIGTASGY